jgi:hypothetical protein
MAAVRGALLTVASLLGLTLNPLSQRSEDTTASSNEVSS